MPDGFRPGDRVPATGIYRVKHYQHRLPHEVFAVEGDRFPECRRCGKQISFTLIQPATHIGADRDFFKTAGTKAKKARAGHKKSP